MRRPTLVTWQLSEVDTGTHLRLDHSGFTGLGGLVLAFLHRTGWPKIVRIRLAAHLGSRV